MSKCIVTGGLSAVLVVVAWTTGCLAQEPDASPLARTLAPYVDGQTLAVVHVDLAAINPSQAVGVLARFLRAPDKARERMQAEVVPINVFADALPEGARADVFAVTSISDVARLPLFLVLPLDGGAPASVVSIELRRALDRSLHSKVATEQIGEALVTGSPGTLERLQKAKPSERPEIAAGFEAVADSAVHLLLVPSADARRLFELLVPKMPAELGGGPTRGVTQRVTWVAVGLDFSPNGTDVHVVTQTSSEEAARVLAREIEPIVASLFERADGVENPDAEHLARRLVPRVEGDRLVLEMTASDDEIAQMGRVLGPLMQSAERAMAQRFPGRRAADP